MRLYFKPYHHDIPTLLLAARHKNLWRAYGPAIQATFRDVTGVPFARGVTARVRFKESADPEQEHSFSWSHAGKTNRYGMLLCYEQVTSEEDILSELCHELSHRLLAQHGILLDTREHRLPDQETIDYEQHRTIFVFLIDVYERAFDTAIARRIIDALDKRYIDGETPDSAYRRSWEWARSLTPRRRRELTSLIFRHRQVVLPEE